MPPASKSRSSVAAELVLALSKPKGRVSPAKEDQKPPAKSNNPVVAPNGKKRGNLDKSFPGHGNNDWISFLKTKKQGNPIVNSSSSPSTKTSSARLNVQNSSPKLSEKIKKEPGAVEETHDDKEKEKNKDKVLKSLMDQVSSLETTLGGKILNLEASLKFEKSKSKQLENSLEKELKLQQEVSSKLRIVEKDRDLMEKGLRSRIEELSTSLEEEKRKGARMATDFAKFKVDTQEEAKLKDAEIIEILTENEDARSRMTSMIAWKMEMRKKVSESVRYCRINHTEKLKTVLDENFKLRSVLKEAKDNFNEVIQDMTLSVNNNAAKNSNFESQVSTLERELRECRQELARAQEEIITSKRKSSDGAGDDSFEDSDEEALMIDEGKDETEPSHQDDLKEDVEEITEESGYTAKRKRSFEDAQSPNKKPTLDLDDQASDEVECLFEKNQVGLYKDEIETIKKSKESLRDAILSSLSRPNESSSERVEEIQDLKEAAINNENEDLLQSSPESFVEDEDEDLQELDDDEEIQENMSKSDVTPESSGLRDVEKTTASSDNFFRLINECEESIEDDLEDDLEDEVDVDLLYGDLEDPSEVGDEDELTSLVGASGGHLSVDDDHDDHDDLDQSWGSRDSNRLVIDLDRSCDSLTTETADDDEVQQPSNVIKEILVDLVHSI